MPLQSVVDVLDADLADEENHRERSLAVRFRSGFSAAGGIPCFVKQAHLNVVCAPPCVVMALWRLKSEAIKETFQRMREINHSKVSFEMCLRSLATNFPRFALPIAGTCMMEWEP